MLTSTYTLVSLSVEQTIVRTALHSIVRELRALPADAGILAPQQAGQLCATLRRVVDHCRSRKLEKFLVPALRRHAGPTSGLLAEIDQLSRSAGEALAAAEASVDAGKHGVDRDPFSNAVERCAESLRRRLECEEFELFPLARSVVTGETWFAIANQMLAHDAATRERRETPEQDYAELGNPLHEGTGLVHAGFESGRSHARLPSMH